MDFSLFSALAWPHDRSRGSGFEEDLERFACAEAQGYRGVWLANDHASRHGVGPAIHLTAANLAARTHTLRIGAIVAILPFMHPLRIAEEVAMLDIVSGGRLDWGVVCGDPGTQRGALFHEQLEVIEKAWSGRPFSHAGAHYRFDELACHPDPVQPGGPTIHLAASHGSAFAWAARHGRPVLSDPFLGQSRLAPPHEPMTSAAPGSDGTASPTAVVRHVHVGETSAKAREAAASALLASYRAAVRPSGVEGDFLFPCAADGDFGRAAGEDALVAHLLDACAIVGDAVFCRDRIAELEETQGIARLIAWHDFGGLDAQESRRSQQRLIEEVAPAFA